MASYELAGMLEDHSGSLHCIVNTPVADWAERFLFDLTVLYTAAMFDPKKHRRWMVMTSYPITYTGRLFKSGP